MRAGIATMQSVCSPIAHVYMSLQEAVHCHPQFSWAWYHAKWLTCNPLTTVIPQSTQAKTS